MDRIYDRLPQSLVTEDGFTDGVVFSGLNLSAKNFTLSLSPGIIGWGFGLLETPEIVFDSETLEGEYILGVTAEQAVTGNPLSVPLESYSVKGDFLDKRNRPENLLVPGGTWIPGFAGAELHLSLEGFFTSIEIDTESRVLYNGQEYLPQGGKILIESFEESDFVTLLFPDENSSVFGLNLNGFNYVSSDKIDFSFFLQPVGRDIVYKKKEKYRNLYSVSYKENVGWEVLRDFRVFLDETSIDLSRVLTYFFDSNLNDILSLRETYVEKYIAPETSFLLESDPEWETRRDGEPFSKDRVEQGLAFLGQMLGWSGAYGSISKTNTDKRNAFDLTFGRINIDRSKANHYADAKIIFTGDGYTDWVDFENTEIKDWEGKVFTFPGVPTAHFSNGFPVKESPVVYKGSALYFEEPPKIEGIIPEYVDSKNLWKVVVEKTGSFFLSSKVRPSEQTEVFVEEWLPEELELEENYANYFGSWGSKGTSFLLEHLLISHGIPGFIPEESLILKPFTVRYILPEDEDFFFDEILVDGENLGGRKVKGIENISTAGSRIIRLSCYSLEFSTVEIKLTNFIDSSSELVDMTELILSKAQFSARASLRNCLKLPRLWGNKPFVCGVSTANTELGLEFPSYFVRLPYHLERGGEIWSKAEKIAQLFSMKRVFSEEKPGEKTLFYRTSFHRFRDKRLFHREYLISMFEDSEETSEVGWTNSNLFQSPDTEAGWKNSSSSPYIPSTLDGNFYERITEDNLSGVFQKDLSEGKIILARDNTKTATLSETERLEELVVRVCYPYFTCGYSFAGDPVYEPEFP